jgi:hypothetical protein
MLGGVIDAPPNLVYDTVTYDAGGLSRSQSSWVQV